LVFTHLYETDVKDSYVGTLLVTDSYGIRLNSNVHTPVKATAIQKALYGERLQHILVLSYAVFPLLNQLPFPDFYLWILIIFLQSGVKLLLL